jgi:hypothetical protein
MVGRSANNGHGGASRRVEESEMRSVTLIVSGLLALLAIGLGATPAWAADATGACGVVAFDPHGDADFITVPNGNFLAAGTVNISLPCDGGLWLSFTTELDTASAGALVIVAHAVTCVAPAVPNGCTVSSTLLPVSPPDSIRLQAGATGGGRTSRTANVVLTGLLRGNYHVEWLVSNSNISGTVNAFQRLSSAQGFGTLPTPPTLPTTPPGSSQ